MICWFEILLGNVLFEHIIWARYQHWKLLFSPLQLVAIAVLVMLFHYFESFKTFGWHGNNVAFLTKSFNASVWSCNWNEDVWIDWQTEVCKYLHWFCIKREFRLTLILVLHEIKISHLKKDIQTWELSSLINDLIWIIMTPLNIFSSFLFYRTYNLKVCHIWVVVPYYPW